MIGPDVTVQLAYDEAVIRTEHQILTPALCPSAACRRSSARQYTAVRYRLCGRVRPLGSMGKKDINERY
jgi:hypothetical protein